MVLSEDPLTTSLSLYWRQAMPRLWPLSVRTNSHVLVLHTCKHLKSLSSTSSSHYSYQSPITKAPPTHWPLPPARSLLWFCLQMQTRCICRQSPPRWRQRGDPLAHGAGWCRSQTPCPTLRWSDLSNTSPWDRSRSAGAELPRCDGSECWELHQKQHPTPWEREREQILQFSTHYEGNMSWCTTTAREVIIGN